MDPVEPSGRHLLQNLPDTKRTRELIRRLRLHQDRTPYWPRACKRCGESFKPMRRNQRYCLSCR